MEALQPFKVANYPQDPEPMPYLKHEDDYNFDIHLEVAIKRTNDRLFTVQENLYFE